jgi:hypothetical protein
MTENWVSFLVDRAEILERLDAVYCGVEDGTIRRQVSNPISVVQDARG